MRIQITDATADELMSFDEAQYFVVARDDRLRKLAQLLDHDARSAAEGHLTYYERVYRHTLFQKRGDQRFTRTT